MNVAAPPPDEEAELDGPASWRMQFEQYKATRPDPGLKFKTGADLLAWWGSREEAWPDLTKYARWVFSVQPSSAASERLFSAGGRVHSRLRMRQLPGTIWKNTLLVEKRDKAHLRRLEKLAEMSDNDG